MKDHVNTPKPPPKRIICEDVVMPRGGAVVLFILAVYGGATALTVLAKVKLPAFTASPAEVVLGWSALAVMILASGLLLRYDK
jgi:hypothetical protein